MLKVCSPVVVPIVSWSKQCPLHEISEVLFSPKFSEIVTGASSGELIIWTFDNKESFWPRWMCTGHVGSIKNLGFARIDAKLSDSYFFSHTSTNELAIWNWEDGTCVDIRVDQIYHHTRIKSFKPSFTDAHLLFCSGQYPCIVVMHALQLSNLFTLASNAHPNWIQDFALFTHTHLKQEVVLGVSNSGVVIVWTLTGKETLNSTTYEHESRTISTNSPILQIHCCEHLPRLVLLICVKEWRILDAIDCSTQTFHASCDPKEHYVGGSFFHREYLAIYTNAGEVYIYHLPKNSVFKIGSGLQVASLKPQLVIKLRMNDVPRLKRPIRYQFQHTPVTKMCKANLFRLGAPEKVVDAFLCGCSDGTLCVWGLTTDQLVEPGEKLLEIPPFLRTRLSDVWQKISKHLLTEVAFFNHTSIPTDVVTSCIIVYASTYATDATPKRSLPPLLIRGTSTGDLIITSPASSHRFRGHCGAVLALLHPFSFAFDSTTFRPNLFLSGGDDFAVRLWDLEAILFGDEEKGETNPLAVFYNHAAPIIALLVGPVTRPSSLAGCVIVVADDGTVSVLSPNDKYTLIRARTASGGYANTPATVHAISWRLAEMLLLILAADGSLAVWDIRSGQLERCEMGSTAVEIFNTGSETFTIGSSPLPSLPSFFTCPVNQSASAASVSHRTAAGRITRRNSVTNQSARFLPPLLLQSVGINVCGGPAAFVFHFDPEALISNLLSSAIASKDMESTGNDIPLSLQDCGSLVKLLLSVIYPWSDDPSAEYDVQVLGALQLAKRPQKPHLGCLSMAGYLTLRIPCPPDAIDKADYDSSLSTKVVTNLRLVQVALADALCCMPADRLAEIFPSSIPIDSLLIRSICSSTSSSSHILHQMRLHTLLARWQTKCLHMRYSARTLTYSLLDSLSTEERRNLVNQWVRFLPEVKNLPESIHATTNGIVNGAPTPQIAANHIDAAGSTDTPTALDCCESQELLKMSIKLESGIFDSFAFGPSRPLNASSVHRYRVANCAILILAAIATRVVSEHLSPALAARDLCVELNYPLTSAAASLSPYYHPLPPEVKITTTVMEDEVLRRIASALMVFLDYTPPDGTKRQALAQVASPIRRTAIDFLGRGFPLWEPYVDTAHLLNSLLSLIASEVGQLADLQPGEVFNEQRDVARASRQALWRLTFTRPHLVILTLSLMLRRLGSQALNAMLTSNATAVDAGNPSTEIGGNSQRLLRVVVSSPALASPIFAVNSGSEWSRHLNKSGRNPSQPTNQAAGTGQPLPLLKAAVEVLRVLTELSGRRGVEMTPILPELVEVVLVCVDRTRLRERGLHAVFPILQRFHSVDSHTRAQKVCVGGTNGMLIFFDFKSGRYNSTSAHNTPITAVCFNSEGRQLASYSMQENTIKTWQLSSTGLFGIGSQQVRALNTYPIRPLQRPGSSTASALDPTEIVLTWPEPGVVNVLHADVLIRSVTLCLSENWLLPSSFILSTYLSLFSFVILPVFRCVAGVNNLKMKISKFYKEDALTFLVVIIVSLLTILLPVLHHTTAHSPYSWYPRDNFDFIMEKMSRANPNNCKYLSEADLTLPTTTISQMPKYNQIPLQVWYANRSKLLHLHNLALNRAFFFSYILQRLNDTRTGPALLPSHIYYYFSGAADISSAPNAVNTSGIYMDTNCSYASWYVSDSVNTTFPLFAPVTRRLDDWNDETNVLRIPTNNTIESTDMGAGPYSNYTAPWYRNNFFIHDTEMGINFIPDNRGTAIGKNQYATRTHLADLYGNLVEMLEAFNFFGPNAPGIKETFLPVRFTRPYYDCGHSNRWIVSAVSALSDYMPRYSPIDRLRGPRMVGVTVTSMDFLRIDFNPCPQSMGNPDYFLAGTARCKPTTMCVPLSGYGFARGGYECVCQPGYRLPMQQNGPFRGIDIEQATEEEYKNGFDCLPVGWRQVVPHEIAKDRLQSAGGDQIPVQRPRRSPWYSTPLEFVTLPTNYLSLQMTMFLNKFGFLNAKKMSPLSDIFHKVDDTAGHQDARPMEPSLQIRSMYQGVNKTRTLARRTRNWKHRAADGGLAVVVKRKRKDVDIPFYYLGNGYTFNEEAYNEVIRLIAYIDTVTPENCASKSRAELQMPSGVSYGAEAQFEMEGRVALRLAHFLSAYYQNNIVGELYGNLRSGVPLNRFELFGEVYANVLSSFQIVSSGIFFDRQAFVDHEGITWDLFAPFAYKPSMATQVAEAIDMSARDHRNYTEQAWFRVLKERWKSSRQGLESITTKPYIRSNINGTQIQRYFNFPLFYRVPRYEEGYWTEPYYVCYGFFNGWVITYATPFFGYLDNRRTLDFMGVVTVSVDLHQLDINQCPQSFYTPNFFKNTARCDFQNTYCEHIPGRQFRSGSYKCMCRQGFEYPLNDLTWFFDGETMEKEYELKMSGQPSRYDLLKCRQGHAMTVQVSMALILVIAYTVAFF
ncbi:fras1 related extracellular matrix protein [Echinococcus multilocularis]|uniref:Fras1 related extracellular matrix protein n=1 Tax=Echinococcus multilocularis TaxID=6211 RepID=A0A087VY23_ECHMU|nr:fras1 related extracellular matrix protein [Echinococcus multilocularis]